MSPMSRAAKFRRKYSWCGADPCVYCGQPSNTRDHILPLSRGGVPNWTNWAPACRTCNGNRSNRPLLVWLIVLDRKRRGKELAKLHRSRTFEYGRRHEKADGLHVSQWSIAPASPPVEL